MKCIKNRKRLLKPIKKKYRDTLILTGILILFFGVGITALVLLRRSSQLDMTSAYSVKEEMYGTHGAEISTQKADSFASSYAVSSGNMSLEGVAISDTTKAGLFDLDHGSVMFAQNIHEKSYPASITKIMTAILAFKNGNMDDIVTIPAEALNQESGSTEIGFQEGDQVTLDELLHGLLIYSGNDAAVAIAQHIGGSVDQFVEMMNQEALELGATNTHFANPSGLQDESFIKKINRFVFRAALPLLLLEDLWSADFQTLWDGKFVGFCAAITIGGGLVSVLCSRLVKDENIRGEFAQAAFRSNSALLGIAFISNIYGKSDMASLMLIGNVPFNNILAVIILLFMKPDGEKKAAGNLAKETVKGILTNPIILGIAGGMLLSVCHVPQVTIVSKTVHNLTSLATPLGLMAMGGSFEGEKAIGQIRPALGATFLRLAGIAMIALPLAALSGLRNEQMVGALVVAGSSSAVSCFIMAKNMGHEGTLTSSVVMLTTLGSAFTMTAWLYVLRCFGLV